LGLGLDSGLVLRAQAGLGGVEHCGLAIRIPLLQQVSDKIAEIC